MKNSEITLRDKEQREIKKFNLIGNVAFVLIELICFASILFILINYRTIIFN